MGGLLSLPVLAARVGTAHKWRCCEGRGSGACLEGGWQDGGEGLFRQVEWGEPSGGGQGGVGRRKRLSAGAYVQTRVQGLRETLQGEGVGGPTPFGGPFMPVGFHIPILRQAPPIIPAHGGSQAHTLPASRGQKNEVISAVGVHLRVGLRGPKCFQFLALGQGGCSWGKAS